MTFDIQRPALGVEILAVALQFEDQVKYEEDSWLNEMYMTPNCQFVRPKHRAKGTGKLLTSES